MDSQQVSRRDFIGDSAKVAAGVAVGLGSASHVVRAAEPTSVDTSKILNYNENMEYRRCGKSGLMVSAVCLGGHSAGRQVEVSHCVETTGSWSSQVRRLNYSTLRMTCRKLPT